MDSAAIKSRVDKIHELYAQEQKNPKKATKLEDIPEKYESITAEWLTAVVGRDTPGAEVTSFHLGPKDDGTANRRRIHMEWNDKGKDLPKSVFCKATQELNNRVNMSFGGIDSETVMFNQIAGKIVKDIVTPVAIWAKYDPESYNSIIVMYDLADEVDFCSYKTNITKEMFKDQVYTLAKIHGSCYLTKDPVITKLMTFAEGFSIYDAMTDCKTACNDGWRASESVIPPELYKRAKDNTWDPICAVTERNAKMPRTLVHSDVHVGNWFHRKDTGKMGIQDFQCLSQGHWARDFAYLLSCSPSPENRKAWEKEMMTFYLAEFKKAGGPEISEEDAWFEVRLQLFAALAYWTLTISPTPAMPVMQPHHVCIAIIERQAAAMQDLDAFGAYEELLKREGK